MTAYVTWRTNGSGEKFLDTYSTIAGDKPELIPPQGVNADEVAIPYPLDVIFGTWEGVFSTPLSQLFYAPAGTTVLQLVPITSWHYVVTTYDLGPPSFIVVNFLPGEGFLRIQVTPEIEQFFPLAYPGLEVDPPLSWGEIKDRGRSIIVTDLLPYVTSSAITGDPVAPSVVAVQSVCVDPESSYATPLDALPDFQSGAIGIAITAGYPWPPPLA